MNMNMGRMMPMMPMMPGSNMPGAQMGAPVPNLEGVLYVGNLHPDVVESQLFEIFSHYGRPQLVRLMRDAYTGESRRFAFVSYLKKEDAEKAKDALNYSKLFDREIRICFKRTPGDFKPKANIFVKNLDRAVTTKQLEEHTKEFGNILSCVVRLDEKGESLGYGYVQYEDEESATKAIEGLNGKDLLGTEWSVNEFVPRKNRALAQKKNLYVKNFPASWDKEKVEGELDTMFGEFGTISCKGVYSYSNSEGKSSHFAFVAYESVEEAEKAIAALNGKELEGKVEEEEALYVDYAQSKSQRREMLKKKHLTYQSVTNLYIKSLKEDVTDEQIREVFEKWGKVTSICLRSAKGAISKDLKFGFVNYSSAEEATKAYAEAKKDEGLKSLIDSSHFPNIDFIYYAQSKSVRRQYLQMKQKNKQAMQMNMMGFMGGFGMFGRGGGPKFNRGRRNMQQSGPGSSSSGSGMGGFASMNPMMSGPGSFMNDPNMGMMMNPMGFGFNMHMNQQPGFPMQNQTSSYAGSNNPGSTTSGQQNSVNNTTEMPTSFLNSINNTTNMTQPEENEVEMEEESPQFTVEWLKDNKSDFMSMSEEDQKNILGNLMYRRVNDSQMASNDLVPKITGMLIDLDILDYEEIIDILENDNSLKDRITEAIEVMNDSN